MLSEPVGSLIIKNAVPTIITMMITAIYNTADTFLSQSSELLRVGLLA